MPHTRTAFVTGADRGLGRALVDEFARRGLRVFAGIHTPDTTIVAPFGSSLVHPVHLEVASDASVAAAAAEISRHTESLDVLVNNAGRLGDIEQGINGKPDFADVLRSLDVNAVGPLRVTHAVVELMKRGSLRSIVNISSEAASIATQNWRSGWFGYCMSKAALNMGSVLCQNGLAQHGFHTTLLHPGYLKTYMHGAKNENAHFEPEEVAGFICDVALDPAKYASGAGVPFLDHQGRPLPW